MLGLRAALNEVLHLVSVIRFLAAYQLLLDLEEQVQEGLAHGDEEARLVHEEMKVPEVAKRLEEARKKGKACTDFVRASASVSGQR